MRCLAHRLIQNCHSRSVAERGPEPKHGRKPLLSLLRKRNKQREGKRKEVGGRRVATARTGAKEKLELLIDKTENLVDSVSMGYFSECKVEKLRLMANIIGQCLKFSPVVFSSFSNLHYVIML